MASLAKPTTQIDNIYSNNQAGIIIAAVSLDWEFLVYFDGLGWTRDNNAAVKFATIRDAILSNDLQSPTPHAPEIWRSQGGFVNLLVPQGTMRFRSRPTRFAL